MSICKDHQELFCQYKECIPFPEGSIAGGGGLTMEEFYYKCFSDAVVIAHINSIHVRINVVEMLLAKIKFSDLFH